MQRIQSIEPSGKVTYDVIVFGSGAAGGMATCVLATKGANVLLLEAGGNSDVYKSKTMEWPYDTRFRGVLAPSQHALNVAEYEMLDRPYGLAKEMAPYKKVYSYAADRYTKSKVADERESPFTGTPYAWVRAATTS